MKKLITILLSATLLIIGCSACGSKTENANPSASPSQTAPAKDDDKKTPPADLYANKTYFTIEMENGGVMKGELYPDLAPISVANFIKLANDKFYDGLIFHRVMSGFMIQGGGFTPDMKQKPADTIKGEFSANGVKNDLPHTRGVISMARTNVPDSASSQFFIMHADTASLNGQYAAFGKITEGLEIVDEIAATETKSIAELGMDDIPVEPQIIKTITIQNK